MPSLTTVIRHSLALTFTGQLVDTPQDRQSLKRLRRYTPLQKTLTELLHRFRRQFPTAYEELHQPEQSAVIYGSALGELHINLSQTADILSGSLPLSPVKFQRSVLNASYSQCAIAHGITCAATALTRGFLTADAAIALADMLLASGDCDRVLILIGDEHTEAALSTPPLSEPYEQAYGQALWLRQTATPAPGDAALTSIRYSSDLGKECHQDPERGKNAVQEPAGGAGYPAVRPWQPEAERITINHRGEGYTSRWQVISPPNDLP